MISTLIGTDKITKQEQNLKLFSGHFCKWERDIE